MGRCKSQGSQKSSLWYAPQLSGGSVSASWVSSGFTVSSSYSLLTAAAAAAAKSLQSCLTLWDHVDGSPPGSPIPGILQARTLEWVAISFSNAWEWKMAVKLLTPRRLVCLFFLSCLRAHQLTMATRCTHWGRWHCLLIDKAGNILFLNWDSSPPVFPLKPVMAEQNLLNWSSLCPYC